MSVTYMYIINYSVTCYKVTLGKTVHYIIYNFNEVKTEIESGLDLQECMGKSNT